MADDVKSLTLKIKGDTQQARNELNALLKDIKGLDTGVIGVGKTFGNFGAILGGLGVGAILGTLATGIRAVITQTAEAERIQGKLNAVLKATDGAAGLTADKLNDMADALARTTEFDDDRLKEAMTVLLAFPAVGRDVFGEAIRLATDLSVVMGGDLNGAARAVGRALQDPVGGLRLLKTELGVNTDALGANNEALIKSGDLLGAQKNVIAELQSRLGGAAEGANTGLYGATHDVSKAWDDLLKTLGRTPEISAGAQISLTTLTGILRLLNEELKQRNENLLRSFNVLPPQRLTTPREVGRIDTSGLPPVHVQTAGELEAEKKASEDFRQGLADLEKRTALLGQEKVAEQILFEVQKGRYKDLRQNEKDALVAAAQRLDADKELQDSQQEAENDLIKQIAAEAEYNDELKKSAEKIRDVIDPSRALFAEMSKIDDLYQRGILSIDEYLDATLEVQGRLNELGKDAKKTATEMTEFTKEAARGMTRAFADEFFNIFEGKIDNLGESFVRLLHRLAAELAASEVMKFLTGDYGKTGQLGGVLGTLIASTAHTGGVVGAGLPGRAVPALAFAGAPRMHTGGIAGLAPDEVPTILRKGETVLTPEQMRGGPGNVKVQIENKGTPQEVTDSQVTFDPDAMVVSIMLKDLARGGPVSGGLARAFNLRRS